jgi:hypothetical protein
MTHRTCAQLFVGVFLGLLVGAAEAAPILSDDFNDGNDDGWTQFDPNRVVLEGVPGQYVNFDTAGGAYRIQSFSSGYGTSPSRGMAYRADQTFTAFRVTADVVAFNASVDQRFGIAARFREFEPANADGYLLTYNPSPGRAAGGRLQIYRITNELYTAIGTGADVSPALLATTDFELDFRGAGSAFTGRLLSSTGSVLATASATDATYEAGYTGLLVTNRTDGTADATFDNFVAAPEPGSLALVGLAVACGAVRRRRRHR